MPLKVTFLDVGQGDSTLVEIDDNYFGLIDFGGATAGKRVVAKAIQKHIDADKEFLFCVATHWDRDHVGGLPAVFDVREPKYFIEGNIPVPLLEEVATQEAGKDLSEAIKRRNDSSCTFRKIGAGNTIPWSDTPHFKMYALSPDVHIEDEIRVAMAESDPATRAMKLKGLRNKAAVTLYLEMQGASVFLLGEISSDQYDTAWEALQRHVIGFVPPKVVRLAHHGSINNFSEATFSYLKTPFVAVGSAGALYGHPDVRVLDRVEANGGITACTNLGGGCYLLQKSGVGRPRGVDLIEWREEKSKETLPGKSQSVLIRPEIGLSPCYSHITANITSSNVSFSFSKQQSDCPFSGPAASSLLI